MAFSTINHSCVFFLRYPHDYGKPHRGNLGLSWNGNLFGIAMALFSTLNGNLMLKTHPKPWVSLEIVMIPAISWAFERILEVEPTKICGSVWRWGLTDWPWKMAISIGTLMTNHHISGYWFNWLKSYHLPKSGINHAWIMGKAVPH